MAEPQRPQQDEARLAAIRAALAELQAEYAEGLPRLVDEIDAAGQAACSSGEEAQLRHLRTLAHRMHGAAGSYGFKEVSASAAKLEVVLTQHEERGLPTGATLLSAIRASLTELRETAERELERLTG